MEKRGIGYEEMKRVKPDIIYARIKGFGMTGPWANYNCYDMVAQAAAGAFSITGEADGPPLRPGPTTGDSGSGVQMALAITAAYVQRMRTGEVRPPHSDYPTLKRSHLIAIGMVADSLLGGCWVGRVS